MKPKNFPARKLRRKINANGGIAADLFLKELESAKAFLKTKSTAKAGSH